MLRRSIISKNVTVSSAAMPVIQVRHGRAGVNSSFDLDSDVPYTEQMRKLGRPVSPSMSFTPSGMAGMDGKGATPKEWVYSFPLFVLGHVMFVRATGVVLTIGMFGMGAISLLGGDAAAVFASIGQTPVIGSAAKFAVTFPLVAHTLGGVRHIYGDTYPENVQVKFMEETTNYIAVPSILLSTGVMFL